MLIPNCSIRVLDPRGTERPGFSHRVVQWVAAPLSEDAGMVEIVSGGSSAMAPIITGEVIDFPDAIAPPESPLTTGLYQDPSWGPPSILSGAVDPTENYVGPLYGYERDGEVYILEQYGHGGQPLITPGPWHILRVQRPPGLTAHVHVRLARVDFLVQTAVWYQHITMSMPGAFRTTAWQPDLQQLMDTGDGSYGIGVGMNVGQTQYLGYLPGVKVQLGLNEYASETRSEEFGTVDYEHPVIIYEKPLLFSKFDIIALADGRRVMCSDLVHRFQRLGITLAILQMVELWRPDGLIYQVNP